MSTCKNCNETFSFQFLGSPSISNTRIKKLQITTIRNQMNVSFLPSFPLNSLCNSWSQCNTSIRRTISNEFQCGHQTQNQWIRYYLHGFRQFRPKVSHFKNKRFLRIHLEKIPGKAMVKGVEVQKTRSYLSFKATIVAEKENFRNINVQSKRLWSFE